MLTKPPPNENNAEASFLSACIIDGSKELSELLTAEDFYKPSHGLIYQSIIDVHELGMDIDLNSIVSDLSDKKSLDKAGGIAYIAGLVGDCPISINPEQDAQIIKKAAVKRKIIEICNRAMIECFDGCNVSTLLGDLRNNLSKIDAGIDCDSWIRMGDISDKAIELWESNKYKKGITGITTGLIEVDRMLGGWQPGCLYIIAGRPGMGKSAFAFCAAKNAAMKGHPVGIISIEMGNVEVLARNVSDISGVDGERLRNGDLEFYHWEKITDALEKIDGLPIWIDDSPTANITSVQRKIRRFVKKQNDKPLIVIDYLQYIEGLKSERKDIEVGTVTRGLKSIAKELNIPVVLLSQLSRNVEQRTDKRPTRSDLRNSGEIEQDADVIAFLYRDEYYNPETEKPGVVEFIVDKFRAGKTGIIDMAWIAHRTTFENLAR